MWQGVEVIKDDDDFQECDGYEEVFDADDVSFKG